MGGFTGDREQGTAVRLGAILNPLCVTRTKRGNSACLAARRFPARLSLQS